MRFSLVRQLEKCKIRLKEKVYSKSDYAEALRKTTEKLHEQRTVNRKLRLFYHHQLATENNNRNAVEEEIKLLRKNLEIEKSKQISTLPDSEITKTLEEHYQEKVDKLIQENESLKKRWSRFEKEVEKNKEVQARESESKSSETNLVTFQVNDIPEWGTLDKNLNLVQSIDLWFQDELKYFFSLVAEDVASKSGSKNSLYTKYLSSSTPNQTYDKIFTKLAHLTKDPSKANELYLSEFGSAKYEVLQLLMERKVALIENYENFILNDSKSPERLIRRLNQDVLNLIARLEKNQNFEDIYGLNCFYLISRYPDQGSKDFIRELNEENNEFISNIRTCIRSIDTKLELGVNTSLSTSHIIKLIDIKVNLEKYTSYQYRHRPIRI